MLKLIPKNWFSWDFRVLQGGHEIALIDRHWYQERASYTLAGRTYDVRRTSLLHGTFVLEHASMVLALATKPSAFQRAFDITIGADQYRLEAASVGRREFHLLQGGVKVGSVRPDSFLRRSATAQMPAQLPQEVQLFLIFLVLTLWKRAADAAD
jgi:hypothetical protein